MSWSLVIPKHALKDATKLAEAGLKPKAEALFEVLQENLCRTPAPYARLVGNLAGACSRRINIQHRLVYEVVEAERVVKVLSM